MEKDIKYRKKNASIFTDRGICTKQKKYGSTTKVMN